MNKHVIFLSSILLSLFERTYVGQILLFLILMGHHSTNLLIQTSNIQVKKIVEKVEIEI